MTYTSDFFVINYKADTEDLVGLILDSLDRGMNRIIDFFELEQLSSKKEIVIYSSIDEYALHVNSYSPYQDWMIADTFDGNINVLSLKCCQQIRSHRNMDCEEYKRLILHEFVHQCQQAINPNAYGCIWFWEALATNLSGQVFDDTEINCTKEQLMYDYINLVGNYSISYKLGKYMLANFDHARILDYVKSPEKLCNELDLILNDT